MPETPKNCCGNCKWWDKAERYLPHGRYRMCLNPIIDTDNDDGLVWGYDGFMFRADFGCIFHEDKDAD